MSRYPRSRGFTLVELLVVIAIIGTLVSLLLPAVQAGREAARRMSCSNNLHNLVLATQQYHDAIGQYPSAWITYAPNGTASDSWAWGALILPWLDQANLHKALLVTKMHLGAQFANPAANPNFLPQTYQTPLKIFNCPSDTGYVSNHLVPNERVFQTGSGAAIQVGVSNYVANEGHLGNDIYVSGSGVPPNTGVMWGDSYCRMADIVDGTSNTIIYGERESLTGRGAAWIGVDNPGSSGQNGVSLAVAHAIAKINQTSSDTDPTSNYSWNTQYYGPSEGFTSLHPNGIQVAFCDGSVRWLNNQILHNWNGGCGSSAPCGLTQVASNPSQGRLGDEKSQANMVYQRLMSRADRLAINADY